MTRKCPVCDSPHDDWISLKRHMWKKQDTEHEHTDSPAEAEKWLVQNGYKDSDGGSSSTAESEPTDTANPVFGSANPDTEPETVGLPCGCEGYDADAAPPKPFRVTCSKCGETYKVKK